MSYSMQQRCSNRLTYPRIYSAGSAAYNVGTQYNVGREKRIGRDNVRIELRRTAICRVLRGTDKIIAFIFP